MHRRGCNTLPDGDDSARAGGGSWRVRPAAEGTCRERAGGLRRIQQRPGLQRLPETAGRDEPRPTAARRAAGVLDQCIQRVHDPAHQREARARIDTQREQVTRILEAEGPVVRAVCSGGWQDLHAGRYRAPHHSPDVQGAAHPFRTGLRCTGLSAAAQRGVHGSAPRITAERPDRDFSHEVAGQEPGRRGEPHAVPQPDIFVFRLHAGFRRQRGDRR